MGNFFFRVFAVVGRESKKVLLHCLTWLICSVIPGVLGQGWRARETVETVTKTESGLTSLLVASLSSVEYWVTAWSFQHVWRTFTLELGALSRWGGSEQGFWYSIAQNLGRNL